MNTYTKNKLLIGRLFYSCLSILVLFFGIFSYSAFVHASSSSAQIDPVYNYAWGENVGWIDFSHVTVDYASTTLSGYAYGENIGFISLNCENTSSCASNNYAVTDENYQGTLGGYAWGENVGWIDFSHVTFSTRTGLFSGYAYGENIGNIIFGSDSDNNKVVADWAQPLATTTPVTSCGTIVYPGTYALGSDIIDTATSTACFTVLADGVTINGLDPIDHTTIHTVTGNGSDYGVDARGVGIGAHGYSVTVENISLINFSNGISTNATSSGNGNGGSLTITNATIAGAVSASGSGSGQNGAVAINNSSITIPSGSSWTLNDGGTGNIVVFNGSSFNTGTIHGTAKFYGTSHMQSGAADICNFYEASSKTGGTCGSIYNLQPYYFAPTSDSLWTNPSNWYWKSGSATTTVPGTASSTPQAQDTVYLGGTPTSIPSLVLSVIYVATSTANTGNIGVDLTNLTGPNTVTNFYNGHSTGNIQGTINLYNNLSLSSVNGTGTFDPNIVINFYDTSHNNLANAPGTLNFYGHSYNASNGTTLNTPNFYDTSYNLNTLSSAIFAGNSNNTGTTTQATFNGTSTNSGSADVATFNNSSYNTGNVGQANFNDSTYNIGTTSDATFTGDLSENAHSSISGFVSGIKTRLYTTLAPQVNLLRSFVDSAWTITADNTLVKLLYRGLIDIFGRNPNTTTTLVEQNGGIILRPLAPGTISSCGVLDTQNGTYTLSTSQDAQNYFFNYAYDTCFIVRANGVTIDGANMTVRTNSNSSSSIAILATSTPSQDGTYNAFTNLTVKNIRFAGFTYAANANGTDNTSGSGGNGGIVSFATSTLNANILANGGNGTANGGNGGIISINNVNARGIGASTTLSVNGGNSTSCGNGGANGTVNTLRSSYNIVSVLAGNGSNTGCPSNSGAGHSGSSSGGHVDVGGNGGSSDPVADAQAAATQAPATPTHSQSTGGGSVGPGGVFNILPPVTPVGKLDLKPLPAFGETTGTKKGDTRFSFIDNVQKFLFAPLSVTTDKAITTYLNSVGITHDQDLVSLRTTPIAIKKDIPGLFTVTTNLIPQKTPTGWKTTTAPLTTYLASSKDQPLSESVTVLPHSTLTITFTPTGKGTPRGTFNGTEVTFTKSGKSYTATITVPTTPGTYVFKTPSAPLPLTIVIPRPKVAAAPQSTPIIPTFFSWLRNIF